MLAVLIGALCLVPALCFYMLLRNALVYRVRMAFIDDPKLWPDAYAALPDYDQMLHGWRHQGRWTKAHWVEYVRSLG